MKFSQKKGFTLIELLVVVAIIGVLASVVLGSLNDARAKARDARRDADIKSIQNQLELYYIDNGKYPTEGWRDSNASTWGTLETLLGVNLPRDPINDATGSSRNSTALVYSYYASAVASTWCNGQAYVLVYNKETSNSGAINGVVMCDGIKRTYGNAFVVGVSPRQ